MTRITAITEAPPDVASLRLPYAEITASCGFPSPAQDYSTTEIDLTKQLIANPLSTYIMRTSGDSMVDAGIWDGDEIIVDCSVQPRPGDVVVVTLDGEMLVKFFALDGKDLILTAANPSFPPIRVSELSEVRIWGVVTYGIRHIINRPI